MISYDDRRILFYNLLAESFEGKVTSDMLEKWVFFRDHIKLQHFNQEKTIMQELDSLEILMTKNTSELNRDLAQEYEKIFWQFTCNSISFHLNETGFHMNDLMDEPYLFALCLKYSSKAGLPEDHIAVQLYMLADITSKMDRAFKDGKKKHQEKYFYYFTLFHQHFIHTWISPFGKCVSCKSSLPFYPLLIQVLTELIEKDKDFIKILEARKPHKKNVLSNGSVN